MMVQADAPFRMQPEDIGRLKVRNSAGDMIPLSALLTIKHSSGHAPRGTPGEGVTWG